MSLIIVEGKEDLYFIKNYTEHIKLNGIDVIIAGGKDNIKQCKPNINNAIQRGKKVLIIFDADNNFKNSKDNILKQLEKLGFDKEYIGEKNIFLFPNNKDEGDLETLFSNIAKHKNICKCFDEYINCIKNIKTVENIKLPKNKDKIFAYLDCFGLEREDNYYDVVNFDSDHLLPLKNFLKSIINNDE